MAPSVEMGPPPVGAPTSGTPARPVRIIPAIPLKLTQRRDPPLPKKAPSRTPEPPRGVLTPSQTPSPPIASGITSNGGPDALRIHTSGAAALIEPGPPTARTPEHAAAPYQLPPPFYPASHISAPSSASSSSHPGLPGPTPPGSRYPPNGRATSSSFGASVETPETSPDRNMATGEMMPYNGQYPWFPGHEFGPYSPTLYPHPYANPTFPPDPYQPPRHPLEYNQGGQVMSFYPPEAFLYRPDVDPARRGPPRSSDADQRSIGARTQDELSLERSRSLPSSSELGKAEPATADLQQHLLSQFDSSEWADVVIVLRHAETRFEPVEIPAHGVLIAKSLFLRRLMESCRGTEYPRKVTIEVADSFSTVESYKLALRTLYGGSMGEAKADEDGFEEGLANAAAGRLLELEDVARRGEEGVLQSLSWDRLERVIQYGEEVRSKGLRAGDGGEGEVDGFLSRVLKFVVDNFPSDMVLDGAVEVMKAWPRLPASRAISQAGRPMSHARLSSIQFGDHPTEDGDNAVAATRAISKVLISAPYEALKVILEAPVLGAMTIEGRRTLVRDVVQERERRRREVIEGGLATAEEEVQGGKWEAVRWEEGVEEGGECEMGLRICRTWKGQEKEE